MGKLLDTQDSLNRVWLFVEGPDHEVRREKVAQYQPQRKRLGQLPSQSLGSLDPESSAGGLGSPGLLIRVVGGGVFLGHPRKVPRLGGGQPCGHSHFQCPH
jgi:hypothetical protein